MILSHNIIFKTSVNIPITFISDLHIDSSSVARGLSRPDFSLNDIVKYYSIVPPPREVTPLMRPLFFIAEGVRWPYKRGTTLLWYGCVVTVFIM